MLIFAQPMQAPKNKKWHLHSLCKRPKIKNSARIAYASTETKEVIAKDKFYCLTKSILL